MHLKRLLVAAVVLPLLYFYVTKLAAVYFLFLLAIASALAQHELYSMFNIKGVLRYLGIIAGIAMLFSTFFLRNFFGDLFFLFFLVIACIRLFAGRDPRGSFRAIAVTVASIIYIPGLLGYQMHLREYSSDWIIFLYGCVWASDSMAYYLGSGMGKRKLYEEISPKKTVAGAVGSVAGGMIGSVIVVEVFIRSISLPFITAVFLGMVIGIVSVIGDLVESMFKRDAGIKDSSNILPGHGGMLDKLDSSLFAGPMLYWAAGVFGLIK